MNYGFQLNPSKYLYKITLKYFQKKIASTFLNSNCGYNNIFQNFSCKSPRMADTDIEEIEPELSEKVENDISQNSESIGKSHISCPGRKNSKIGITQKRIFFDMLCKMVYPIE